MEYRQLCLTATARPLLDALAERLGVPVSDLLAEAQPPPKREGENPPVPIGWRLMRASSVSSELVAWMKEIADDAVAFPMFASVSPTYSTFRVQVLARVEWVCDSSSSQVRRGVTLYEPDPARARSEVPAASPRAHCPARTRDTNASRSSAGFRSQPVRE